MDLSKFTIKSQEALQAAQTKAIRHGHLEVDGEHLLSALMEQSDGLVPRLLQRMEVPVDSVASAWRKSFPGGRGSVAPAWSRESIRDAAHEPTHGQGAGRGRAAQGRSMFRSSTSCLPSSTKATPLRRDGSFRNFKSRGIFFCEPSQRSAAISA